MLGRFAVQNRFSELLQNQCTVLYYSVGRKGQFSETTEEISKPQLKKLATN